MAEIAEWLRNAAHRDSHRRALEKKDRRAGSDPIIKDAITVLDGFEALLEDVSAEEGK